MANKGVVLVVWMTLGAMSSGSAFNTCCVAGGVLTPCHQPQMVWINAGGIVANVVNGCFVRGSECGCERNVSNKQLVRKPVCFQLTLLVFSKAFYNYTVSDAIECSEPRPATVFGYGNAFDESFNKWGRNVSSWHGGNKNPTRQLEVKSAHDEPQPKDGSVNRGACFLGHFKADQSLTEFQKEAS